MKKDTKVEPKIDSKAKSLLDYKDSSLHQDFTEIKVLLSILIRDLDVITKLIKIRSGVDV